MSKAKATKVVYHPSITGVSYEVADSDAGSWKDAGWRFTDPAKSTTTTKAADSKSE